MKLDTFLVFIVGLLVGIDGGDFWVKHPAQTVSIVAALLGVAVGLMVPWRLIKRLLSRSDV